MILCDFSAWMRKEVLHGRQVMGGAGWPMGWRLHPSHPTPPQFATMQAALYSLLLVAGAAQLAAGGPIPAAVADKFGAKCLDGTPPTYDVSLNKSSSQWVLFLEGGGWCYGATVAAATTSCASRGGAQWPPSSGAAYDGSIMGTEGRAPREHGGAAIGGIMSSDPAINPDFYTWYTNTLFHALY